MSKKKRSCSNCGTPLDNEDLIRHGGSDYCPKCMTEHIKDEHYAPEGHVSDGRYVAEKRRAWTLKSH